MPMIRVEDIVEARARIAPHVLRTPLVPAGALWGALGVEVGLIFRHQGLMVEGAGAVGVAALLSGAVKTSGRTACVLSGRNVAPDAFMNILSEGNPDNA